MTERTHVPRNPCYLQLMVCFQYHLHVEIWMKVHIAIALNHFPACGRPYCKTRPLVQHPVSHPSSTPAEQLSSALKSTHAKIFLSDQPLHRSGQGWSISCHSKGVWNVSVLLSSVSEYCVTAMNLERQESLDHGDWDSFRNTFPTILSQATTATHTLLFHPAQTICQVCFHQHNLIAFVIYLYQSSIFFLPYMQICNP